jgi:tRNA (guanine37-N1)-methyltransferase
VRIDVVSIFPAIIETALSVSMVGRARERSLLELRSHDLRAWTEDRHRQVDDAPYGGGPGMVMKPEPFYRAVDELAGGEDRAALVVLMTPQGRTLDQALVEELARRQHLVVLCGRYEGYDERVRELADVEISIGDYVLTGGELPAMVLVDAVTRLLPGVLGHDGSALEESFSWGLLEYPQYTRPREWRGGVVPEVLLSGDHARIRRWRRMRAIERTVLLRPDLLERADLSEEERAHARAVLDAGPVEDDA